MNPAILPLFVIVPLLSAGATVLLRGPVVQRIVLLLVSSATLIGGAALLVFRQNTPALAHSIGSYKQEVSTVFVSDTLSALLLVVTAFLTMVSGIFLMLTKKDRYRFVVLLILLLNTGINGVLLTGDLFNLFVWVEVMLLPSYALIAVIGSWRRLGIGRVFVIVDIVTSTILVMGVDPFYGAVGSVNLAALAGKGGGPRVSLAISIILFAFLAKGGVVPTHGWLPRAYPTISAGIMSLFAGIHTKVGIYAAYRVYATVFDGPTPWLPMLTAVVVATIVIGASSTFGGSRIRGSLALQTVTEVGQILIGLAVLIKFSVVAGLLYMVHHMITMTDLVLAPGAVENVYGSGWLDWLSGLMCRNPWLAATFAIGLASLVGLPPTSRLWGKVGLLGASAQADPVTGWLLMGCVALAPVAPLMTLQRLWWEAFWGALMKNYLPDDPTTSRGVPTPIADDAKVSWRMLWPSTLSIGISVLLFFGVGWVWPLFESAAHGLIDVSAYVASVDAVNEWCRFLDCFRGGGTWPPRLSSSHGTWWWRRGAPNRWPAPLL